MSTISFGPLRPARPLAPDQTAARRGPGRRARDVRPAEQVADRSSDRDRPAPRERRERRSWRGSVKVRAFVATAGAALAAWALAATPAPRRDVVWGVTFSPRFARSLGLDPQAIYGEMLGELGVRHVRLPMYWDEVEPSPHGYDFSTLDYYLAEAEARGVGVILVVGYKQPRWPEC